MSSELFRTGPIEDVLEGSRIYCVDRVVVKDGTRLLNGGAGNAVLTSCTLKVYDLSSATPDVSIFNASPAVSAVLKSALTVDGFWTLDSIGYNWFSFVEPTDFAQSGGHVLHLEYKLVTALGIDWADFYKRIVSQTNG